MEAVVGYIDDGEKEEMILLGSEKKELGGRCCFISRRMGMFPGKEQLITVRIPEALVGAFIDQFGKRITISEEVEGTLLVTFHAVPSSILLGWFVGLKSVEAIEPQDVRDRIIDLLQKNMNFYQKKN